MLITIHKKALDEAAEKGALLNDRQAVIDVKTSYIVELESEVSEVFRDFEHARDVVARCELQRVGREAELDRTKREKAQIEQRCAALSSDLVAMADRYSGNLRTLQTMGHLCDENATLVNRNRELQQKLQATESTVARLRDAATLSD